MEKEEKKEVNEKKEIFTKKRLDILVTVLLGLTTLLVAWAGWIGSLHEGNQATNYTKSNNLAAQGNAEYNVSAQIYLTDVFAWNTIFNLQLDREVAMENGNYSEVKAINLKIEKIKTDSCSPRLLEAINEVGNDEKMTSPFEKEDFVNGYFESSKQLLDESQKVMEEGKLDNLRADSYKLVSVIYSIVLFLLGIVGIYSDSKSRKSLIIFSGIILIFGIVYMLTIPMPVGFNITNFFNYLD